MSFGMLNFFNIPLFFKKDNTQKKNKNDNDVYN